MTIGFGRQAHVAVEDDGVWHAIGFGRIAELDRSHGAGEEQLRAEAQRLLPGFHAEIIARQPGRESEVVLDARRGAGLTTAGNALDEQRAKPLGRAIDCRR
jgi:hypothetical protein